MSLEVGAKFIYCNLLQDTLTYEVNAFTLHEGAQKVVASGLMVIAPYDDRELDSLRPEPIEEDVGQILIEDLHSEIIK